MRSRLSPSGMLRTDGPRRWLASDIPVDHSLLPAADNRGAFRDPARTEAGGHVLPSALPQLGEAGGDDFLVRDPALQDAGLAGELVHTGGKARRNRGVVERQIAADQFSDQLRFFGREELTADLGGPAD